MSKTEILHHFRHINAAYNDCSKLSDLSCMLDEFEETVRNNVIDEFAEQISLEISESIIFGFIVDSDRVGNFDDASDKIVDYVIDTVKQIAEQMKGGAK